MDSTSAAVIDGDIPSSASGCSCSARSVSLLLAVLGFGNSTALAAACSVSVTAEMLISAVLTIVLAQVRWRVPGGVLWPLALGFVAVDVALLSANLIKFLEGAWFPIAIGAFTLMRTWRRGRELVRTQVKRDSLRIEHFVASLRQHPSLRVPGTAVFLTPSNQYVPPALLHNLKHN